MIHIRNVNDVYDKVYKKKETSKERENENVEDYQIVSWTIQKSINIGRIKKGVGFWSVLKTSCFSSKSFLFESRQRRIYFSV